MSSRPSVKQPLDGSPAPAPQTSIEAFDRELDYIFATLRRLGGQGSDVEDLAQEVFIVLHKNWPTIDLTRPLRPYIFGVAFRVCCAHRRRRWREIPSDAIELGDDSSNPEAALQHAQAGALLRAALDRVPLDRRAVIVLHDLEGIPVLDVARTLSMSRFGVYARLRKGRRELQAAVRRLSLTSAR